MSKMSTDLVRHALNGPTMGTRWSALFFSDSSVDTVQLRAELQAAVDAVDRQMSTWNTDSDLMRLNAAPIEEWRPLPFHMVRVLGLGLAIGRASGGAFDVGMGEAVEAWGFGRTDADPLAIRAAMDHAHLPTHDILDLANGQARKRAPLSLDLNGIAKGYGVDLLADVLENHGVSNALVGIDGEMCALGHRPDGTAWTIAIEAPDYKKRTPFSMLALEDAAVATSGDYRHWITVKDRRLSHTMDPARGAPLLQAPASVTVIAPTCAEADAWATALMVMGVEEGLRFAQQAKLQALFLTRQPDGTVQSVGTGPLFGVADRN
ncbi:FAD:protein FMN transferase [Marivivens sp. LCG002]|uniref:FAD:protein FMN transferase n=1 Tax=Marivivens sp. LCG002 TaxID=3051171 RepID=UPI002552110B|nr:FAD:protein FMN transferase [Marivivens sp. LCG002]WIV51552.1 FAD:protein FMN transferase [Marivivens sp. LCG002]